MCPVASQGEFMPVLVISSAESMMGPSAMSAAPFEIMLTRPAVLFGRASSDKDCSLHADECTKQSARDNSSVEVNNITKAQGGNSSSVVSLEVRRLHVRVVHKVYQVLHYASP